MIEWLLLEGANDAIMPCTALKLLKIQITLLFPAVTSVTKADCPEPEGTRTPRFPNLQ